MPYSSEEGKGWIADWYRAEAPDFTLDVGAGSGTYARLLRPIHRGYWQAVEVWDPYVERFGLLDLYDDVHVENVMATRHRLKHAPDLILLGDVVEHLELAEAFDVLQWAAATGKHTIVSVPIVHWPQGEIDGNHYETHRHHWTVNEMSNALGVGPSFRGDQVGVWHVRS